MNMRNVHRMFVTYIHRIQESRNTKNTYDFLVQVRNFLLPLILKVFRHKERGTIFLCWLFHLPRPTCVAPAIRPLRSRESRPSSSDQKTQLIDFFKSPKILRARFRCMPSFTSPGPGIFILTSVNDTSPHSSARTELTHVLSRKVLSLTKPKGKIYKTKSFGHYITS